MIESHSFDGVTLLITPIDPLDGDTRASAEHRAVQRLIIHALGSDTQLAHHPSGAPYIIGNGISISVTHCRSHAAIALSASRTVGVDIETPRAQLARVAPRVLSDDELRAYSTPALLLQAWTLKEALYKAALTPGLDFRADIRLPIPPDSPVASVRNRPCDVLAVLTTPSYTLSLVAISS